MNTITIDGKQVRTRATSRSAATEIALRKLFGKTAFFQRDIGIRHAIIGTICVTRNGNTFGLKRVAIRFDGLLLDNQWPDKFVMAGNLICPVE